MKRYGEQALKDRLIFDNPWWALNEKTPQKFKQPAKRVFFNRFAKQIETGEAGRAVCLFGPKRTGKTVMVRQMVARLLENGTVPRNVMLASLSTPTYWQGGLHKVVSLFYERNRESLGSGLLYAFLDELQYMPDWEKDLIKVARDFPQVRLVGILSAGAKTPEESESQDHGYDILYLPPLTFAEFLRFRDKEESLFGQDPANHKLIFNQSNLKELNKEFFYYITFGGFPESVLGKTEGQPSPLFVRDSLISRLLQKDTASFFGINDLKNLASLFSLLAYNTAREVSIEELAQETKIAKNTLRKYLDYLESACLIVRMNRVDKNAKRFQRAVAFKVYITSPCWYSALFGPPSFSDEVYPRLVETAVFCQWLGIPSKVAAMTYASWRGGTVDLVGFKDLQAQRERAPEPNLVIDMDWDQKLSGFGKGPLTLTEFVRMNCNGEEDTLLLTHNLVRTGYHRHVLIQSVPASLYAYGLINEVR